jgi:O-antigen/teichoic acid export membrane protein
MKRSIGTGAGWVLVGNVGYSAFQYGLLMAIAKVGTAADVGRFALGLAIAAPVFMLTNLQLRAALVTDARREHPLGAYLVLRLIGAFVAILVIAGVGLSYDRMTGTIIVLVGLAKSIEAAGDILQGLLQRSERFRRMTASLLARGAGSLAVVGVVLFATGSLALAVVGLALVWAGVLVAIDLRAARRIDALRPSATLPALGELVRVTLPLGVVACLGSLIANVPRYAVENHLGPAALGHFAAMAYLMVAATQPLLALGMAASPRLASAYARDVSEYRQLTGRLLMVAVGLGIAVAIFTLLIGPSVLAMAFSAEYATHASVLRWLGLATSLACVGNMLGCALTGARRFTSQLWFAIIALACSWIAAQILVPSHGLIGAAWSVIAAELVRLVCFGVYYAALLRAPLTSAARFHDVETAEDQRAIAIV